jgi:hypothetical protein
VALLALIASEVRQHARWRLLAWAQGQWLGQVVQVVLAGDQVAGGDEALDRAAVRQWSEHGDWAAPVGDLDRLAGLDPPQQLARPLPKLTHSYGRHVLVVAHSQSLVEVAVGRVPQMTQESLPRRPVVELMLACGPVSPQVRSVSLAGHEPEMH